MSRHLTFTAEFAIPEVTYKVTGPVTVSYAVNGQTLGTLRCDHAGDFQIGKAGARRAGGTRQVHQRHLRRQPALDLAGRWRATFLPAAQRGLHSLNEGSGGHPVRRGVYGRCVAGAGLAAFARACG